MKNRILITNTETHVSVFDSPFSVGLFEGDASVSRWRIFITSGTFNKGWSASGLFAKDYFYNDQDEYNENLDN